MNPAELAPTAALSLALDMPWIAVILAGALVAGVCAGALWGTRHSRRHARRVSDEALTDSLTRLANQTLLADRLAHAASRISRERSESEGLGLAVLFVDVDGFKPLNDSFGRTVGDAMLQTVAARMRDMARANDTLARVGADQFVWLIEGQGVSASATMLAQRLLDTMGVPMRAQGHDVFLSVSIGIALYPEHVPAAGLMAAAEAAKDAAKRAGGGGYTLFEAGMVGDAARQVALQQALRHALARRELSLHYQPKVKAHANQVSGAEALMRWQHPELGWVSPAQFIPVAERFGLIGALGCWVIDEACEQLGQWVREGRECRVAINLSVHQLRQGDVVQRVAERLAHHHVAPHLLVCEVTESAMLDDSAECEQQLRGLADLGVRLSIDDFGTGYSSLARLRRVPATQLKIDRSLVVDGTLHADGRAVLDAVIRLAHALRMEVVAEGVETQAQRECMVELGSDLIQGYLIARPMPAPQLAEWLDAFDAHHLNV